jgi:putative ABC transport system permease protein
VSHLRLILDLLRRRPGRELARQVDEELTTHLELLIEEYTSEGMSPAEARAAAHRRFGDIVRLRTEGVRVRRGTARAVRRASLVDDLYNDVRFALRGLRRNPAFATVVILTLALAMGASAAVFAVVETVLIRPLPFEEPDRVVELNEVYPFDDIRWQISAANLIDWRERSKVFTDVAAISRVIQGQTNLTGVEEPVRIPMARVSPSFFGILGVEAALGRTLLPEDDAPGAASVVVLSHGVWTESFGSDPDVLGRNVRLSDEPHTVVGVMPRHFGFTVAGGPRSLWLPQALPPDRRSDRRQRMFRAVARLRPGVTIEQANSEISAIASTLADEYPETNREEGQPWGAQVVSMRERLVETTIRPSLIVLSGAVGIVLLIAWLNVANLIVARTSARRREIAVRSAIGAGRARVARQLLTEALLLSALGGVAGLGLARWLVSIFTAVVVGDGPFLSETSVTGWVVFMTAVTSIVTAMACGLLPALRAARPDCTDGLRNGSRGDGRRGRVGQLLVALEVSLALVLLIGMGLMIDTMSRISEIPLGFDPRGVEVMSASLDQGTYTALAQGTQRAIRPERGAFVSQALERFEALPGVELAAATTALPMMRSGTIAVVHFEGLDRGVDPFMQAPGGVAVHGYIDAASITPEYFRTMRIRVRQGRTFGLSDDRSAPLVAVVNQALVDEYRLSDALGSTVLIRDGGDWRSVEIVGVVDNVLRMYPRYPIAAQYTGVQPVVYLPYAQPAESYSAGGASRQMSLNFVVRHVGDAEALSGAMRDLMRQADTESPITFVAGMEDTIAENLADRRMHMQLITSLALISIFLALVGVYGVVSFQVGQRVHEIGVRMALGAGATGVVRMIVGEGSRVALLGALLGVAGAMATTRFLANWLYEVGPTDPGVFLAVSVVMVAVAVFACWVPARRAAAVDPTESLRAE